MVARGQTEQGCCIPVAESSVHRRANARRLLLCVAAVMLCALTPRGSFLHKAGNMFVDVSLQFTPAGGSPTTSVVGRLLVPMA